MPHSLLSILIEAGDGTIFADSYNHFLRIQIYRNNFRAGQDGVANIELLDAY